MAADEVTYGARWHWAGSQFEYASPLMSPNADTAGQKGYNIARTQSPQQATWATPTTAGDDKLLYGQGRPMAGKGSQAGTPGPLARVDFAVGTTSVDAGTGTVVVASRLFFDGTVVGGASANDLSRLTDSREKGRIGILGSGLSYAGSYGRVTSESIGRDLNPLGRGDGGSYVAGGLNLGRISPALPGNMSPGGWGNSVNNGCGGGGIAPNPNMPVSYPAELDSDLENTNPNCHHCCTQWHDIMCNHAERPALCIGCKCDCTKPVQFPLPSEIEWYYQSYRISVEILTGRLRIKYHHAGPGGIGRPSPRGPGDKRIWCQGATAEVCEWHGLQICDFQMPSNLQLCQACNDPGAGGSLDPCMDAALACIFNCLLDAISSEVLKEIRDSLIFAPCVRQSELQEYLMCIMLQLVDHYSEGIINFSPSLIACLTCCFEASWFYYSVAGHGECLRAESLDEWMGCDLTSTIR